MCQTVLNIVVIIAYVMLKSHFAVLLSCNSGGAEGHTVTVFDAQALQVYIDIIIQMYRRCSNSPGLGDRHRESIRSPAGLMQILRNLIWKCIIIMLIPETKHANLIIGTRLGFHLHVHHKPDVHPHPILPIFTHSCTTPSRGMTYIHVAIH